MSSGSAQTMESCAESGKEAGLCIGYLLRMLKKVLSLEESSGVLSTAALGTEVVVLPLSERSEGAREEARDCAGDGAREGCFEDAADAIVVCVRCETGWRWVRI